MTPVYQEYPHDPENGVAGDCYRACIASLLDLPTSEVPHFLHDFASAEVVDKRVADFLRPMGLALVPFYYDGEGPTPVLPEGVHYILAGKSPRYDGQKTPTGDVVVHCVIATEGLKVVHDPHPSQHGITGAWDDGQGGKWWTVYMLVRATGGTTEQLKVWRECPGCNRNNRVHRMSCLGCGCELRGEA